MYHHRNEYQPKSKSISLSPSAWRGGLGMALVLTRRHLLRFSIRAPPFTSIGMTLSTVLSSSEVVNRSYFPRHRFHHLLLAGEKIKAIWKWTKMRINFVDGCAAAACACAWGYVRTYVCECVFGQKRVNKVVSSSFNSGNPENLFKEAKNALSVYKRNFPIHQGCHY